METRYENMFSTPEKAAIFIKENCNCDCHCCPFPPSIPCNKTFTCEVPIEQLIEWLNGEKEWN